MKAPDYRTPHIGIDSLEHRAVSCCGFGRAALVSRGFLTTTDHKEIGIRYIVTAFIFLGLGGVEALVMRIQLAGPNLSVLTPNQYNQLFSTHGMTMIFLYASPILSGFSNYLWPLLLGSRDMAFPRLKCLELLDLPCQRNLFVRRIYYRQWPKRRLVQLRAFMPRSSAQPGPQ